MTSLNRTDGWTLIEVLAVFVVLAILATVSLNYLTLGFDSARSDATQRNLMILRQAILGSDYSESTEGERQNYGFLGDIGRLPTALAELSTRGSLPSWAFNTSYGIGAGWRGPYLSDLDTQAASYLKDAWGRAWLYTTTGVPNIASLGADGVSGGSADNTDLVVSLPTSGWRSRVTGFVRDGNNPINGASIQIRYPVAGVIGTFNATSDANGFFQFNSVPFGARSLGVISAPTLGPKVVQVNRSNFSVPDTAFNYFGGAEAVSYTGPVKNFNSGATILSFFTSTYRSTVQLSQIQISWTGGGGITYSKLLLNGMPQAVSPVAANGATTAISATLTIPPNSSSNSLEIQFSGNMVGNTITVVFTWLNRTRTDTVTYTP